MVASNGEKTAGLLGLYTLQNKGVQVVLHEVRLDLEWLLGSCFASVLPEVATCSEFRETLLVCVQFRPNL